MTTILDLKSSIVQVLKDNFKDIKIYSSDVKEGFDRPGFYAKVVPITTDYETDNFSSHRQMVLINYFNGEGSELDSIKVNDKLINAFGMTLEVGQRHFLCRNVRSEYIDSVLQFRFDLVYYTDTAKEDTQEVAKEIEVEIIKE